MQKKLRITSCVVELIFFFFSRLDPSLSLSWTRNHAWKCVKIDAWLFHRFHRIFSSRPRPIMRAIIGWLFPISTRWNFHEIISPTSNGRFYFPISIFDVPLFLLFPPSRILRSLYLSRCSLDNRDNGIKEINRDNIYLSPRKSILTSSSSSFPLARDRI